MNGLFSAVPASWWSCNGDISSGDPSAFRTDLQEAGLEQPLRTLRERIEKDLVIRRCTSPAAAAYITQLDRLVPPPDYGPNSRRAIGHAAARQPDQPEAAPQARMDFLTGA